MMERRNEQVNELVAALAAAQAEFPVIERNREVTVASRSGGTYSYSYATLDKILDAVRKILAAHGLVLTQTLEVNEQGALRLKTTLIHTSGQWIASEMPVVWSGSYQELGSAITYTRRYSACALLGIHPEDDTDASELEPVQHFEIRPTVEPRPDARLGKVNFHAKRLGLGPADLDAYCAARFERPLAQLDNRQIITLGHFLQGLKTADEFAADLEHWKKHRAAKEET